jgi:hypothetical protein
VRKPRSPHVAGVGQRKVWQALHRMGLLWNASWLEVSPPRPMELVAWTMVDGHRRQIQLVPTRVESLQLVRQPTARIA